MKEWPFALWGEDGSDDSDDGGNDGADDSSDSTETTVTMTQKELESTIAKAASRASRKASKELRTSLGFESQDDLNAFVTGTREAQDAEKTDAEKAATELAEERTSLATERSTAKSERISLAVERAIIRDGVTDEATVKRIRTLVRSELGDVDIDTLNEEVATALAAVKADVPSMFTTAAQNSGSGDGGANNTTQTEEQARKKLEEQYEAEYRSRGLVVTIPN